MSARHPVPTSKTSPCDCGSHRGCGHSGCSCGGECAGCRGEGVVRPRFFAGQLLTEEDLEALSAYVVAKGRLHNRQLHGAGVVCGLAVTCHPCGSGKVLVEPGHALDCCGNDIVVPCPQELDVNAMVRRLRIEQLGGHHCGDPCTDVKPAKPKEVTGAGERSAHSTGAQKEDEEEEAEGAPRGRRYCLYVRYCEELDEPVSPYATDEACGHQKCEPTRVREGYRFELRCPDGSERPPDLLDRLSCCLGDLLAAEKAATDAQVYEVHAVNIRRALRAVQREPLPAFGAEDTKALAAGTDQLQAFARDFEQKAEDQTMQPEEGRLREALDALLDTASAVARFRLLNAEKPREAQAVFREVEAREGVSDMVAKAADTLTATLPLMERFESVLSFPRDRALSAAVRAQAKLWLDNPPAAAATHEGQLFAYGAAYSLDFQTRASRDLAELREWLLNRLDKAAHRTDCRLRDEVLAVRVPAGEIDAATFSRAAERLNRALLRYLADCFCAAFNPPCPPCEDAAVLLACLEVDDCEVVDICNLEREFVLSAVALRYWLPPLTWLGEAFELACCDLRRQLAVPPKRRAQEEGKDEEQQLHVFATTAPAHSAIRRDDRLSATLRLTGISDAKARSLINLTGSLRGVVSDAAAATAFRLPNLGFVLPALVRGEDIAAVLEQPQVRAAVGDVVDQRVRTPLLQEVDARLKAVADRAELRPAAVAAAIAEPSVKEAVTAMVRDQLQAEFKRAGTDPESELHKLQERRLKEEQKSRDKAINERFKSELAAATLEKTVRKTTIVKDLEKAVKQLREENRKLAERLAQAGR